jgi:hypothetical protein
MNNINNDAHLVIHDPNNIQSLVIESPDIQPLIANSCENNINKKNNVETNKEKNNENDKKINKENNVETDKENENKKIKIKKLINVKINNQIQSIDLNDLESKYGDHIVEDYKIKCNQYNSNKLKYIYKLLPNFTIDQHDSYFTTLAGMDKINPDSREFCGMEKNNFLIKMYVKNNNY